MIMMDHEQIYRLVRHKDMSPNLCYIDELIRCRDCNWYGDVDNCPYTQLQKDSPPEDFYCAMGEKK